MRPAPLLAVAAAAGGLTAALAAPEAARAQEPPPLSVSTPLPSWRALGGRIAVRGTALPEQEVTLYVGRRAAARATSGAEGRFRLSGRVPGTAGRYLVAVEADGDPVLRLELGRVPVRAARLFAVGDVNLGDRVGLAMNVYGVRYPWLSVARLLRRADVAVANLECAVSTRGSPMPKQYTFRGRPRALRAMARYAGVDVVSLANNHSLDYRRLAFADTLRYAHDYGMKTIGGGRNLSAARRPAFFRLGGIRIALLAYSDIRPPGFDAGPTTSGAAPAFPWYIGPDVRAARRRADVVAVYFHWGIERTFTPTARQRHLASVAFDAGAKVVLGAHPHVLQPFGRPTNRRLVAWSLGNFVFGATDFPGTERTGILRVGLGSRGVAAWNLRRAVIAGPYRVQPQLVG